MFRTIQRFARLAGLGAATLFAGACGSVQPEANGPAAPNFELRASDGNSHTLQSLTAKGPVFFYGIKKGCPINAKAEDYFDQLARAYAGKVTFVGLSNMNAETFPGWRDEFKPSYTVLYDPKKELISGLGIKRSPWIVQVAKNGQIVETWAGYSTVDLDEVSAAMATAAGVPQAKLEFAGAPAQTSYG